MKGSDSEEVKGEETCFKDAEEEKGIGGNLTIDGRRAEGTYLKVKVGDGAEDEDDTVEGGSILERLDEEDVFD